MSSEVKLPISCVAGGRKWLLFLFEYATPDGIFSGYLHAISAEHAAAMLADLKENAELKGQVIEAGL